MKLLPDERKALATIKLPRAKQTEVANAISVLAGIGYSGVRIQSHLFASGRSKEVVRKLMANLK